MPQGACARRAHPRASTARRRAFAAAHRCWASTTTKFCVSSATRESTRSELRAGKIIGSECCRNIRRLKATVPMNNILVVGADRGIANAICMQLARPRGTRHRRLPGPGRRLRRRRCRHDRRHRCHLRPQRCASWSTALQARHVRLDWLLHVAGVLGLDELGKIDYDDMRRQFEINTLGPLRVVEACIPFIGAGIQGRHRHQPCRLAWATTARAGCMPTASPRPAPTWSR